MQLPAYYFAVYTVHTCFAALNAAIRERITRISDRLYGCSECSYATGYLTTMQGCHALKLEFFYVEKKYCILEVCYRI